MDKDLASDGTMKWIASHRNQLMSSSRPSIMFRLEYFRYLIVREVVLHFTCLVGRDVRASYIFKLLPCRAVRRLAPYPDMTNELGIGSDDLEGIDLLPPLQSLHGQSKCIIIRELFESVYRVIVVQTGDINTPLVVG